MAQAHPRQDDPVRSLLALLRDPESARTLGASDWDALVRVARAAGVLARLHIKFDQRGVLPLLPDPVREHLESELTLARFRTQMLVWEIECARRALEGFPARVVLLKGAGYVVQGFGFAKGRFPSDLDLMVPRAYLDAAEGALVNAGWRMEKLDPYDEHYYRAWSHELPPMRYPEHPLELDLHHTILPLTGRAKPNAAALFEAATPVAGTSFHVLCPADQLLHACSQLFQDSDCAGRLRDLADVDSLIEEFRAAEGFWERLVERSRVHGLGRSLFYSLRYAARFLGTDIPREVMSAIPSAPEPGRALMDYLVPRALLPIAHDRPPVFSVRISRSLLFLRSHWLRMPPLLLLKHAVIKGWRSRRPPARAEQ